MEAPGYQEDRCHFCNGKEAGFSRREDGASGNSKYFDACQDCVRKPYPQPKQFEEVKNGG